MPKRPLKILTIDGGGLQAITTLLILDKLLTAIARNNNARKPRPCDVFDTIAGIGAGGWLALLLGRFHMDILACLSEWYKLTSCIAPKSKSDEILMRVLHNRYFDSDRLVGQIEHLTETYGISDNLIADDSVAVRTRYVFVAALKSDGTNYNLFRCYEIPDWASQRHMLLEGPTDPRNFKISRAFGVTGATKYFSPPWKERMGRGRGSKMRFSDTKFPAPHNITEIALNEMWGLHGSEVPLSVVVNIGPGLADPHDVAHIARRFSWGLNVPKSHVPQLQQSESATSTVDDNKKRQRKPDLYPERGISSPYQEGSHLSKRQRKMVSKLRSDEMLIEEKIRKELDHHYGKGSGETLFFRLAPPKSPAGTARNDSEASDRCLTTANRYLDNPNVEELVDKVAQRMPNPSETASLHGRSDLQASHIIGVAAG